MGWVVCRQWVHNMLGLGARWPELKQDGAGWTGGVVCMEVGAWEQLM